MQEAHSQQVTGRPWAPLAISVGWMLVVQLACVLGWEAEWLGRSGALVHWLVVGVLPPALALWQLERVAARPTSP